MQLLYVQGAFMQKACRHDGAAHMGLQAESTSKRHLCVANSLSTTDVITPIKHQQLILVMLAHSLRPFACSQLRQAGKVAGVQISSCVYGHRLYN